MARSGLVENESPSHLEIAAGTYLRHRVERADTLGLSFGPLDGLRTKYSCPVENHF